MLRAAQEHLGMTLFEVWWDYIGVGGDQPVRRVQEWLRGVEEPGDRDHDFLAQAFNDRFLDEGLDHPVAYTEALTH